MDAKKLITAVLFFSGSLGLAQKPDSVFIVASDASAPVVLYKVDAEYTEAAYQAKYSGTVVLRSVIDATGAARDTCVVRSLGLGLDENAIEAVQKWKFRPGHRNGKPVAVQVTIEVNFRLLDSTSRPLPRTTPTSPAPMCSASTPPPLANAAAPKMAAQTEETAQETPKIHPERFKNLSIQVISMSTPETASPGKVPPDDRHHYLAFKERMKNLSDKLAMCAELNAKLKGEFGLVYPPVLSYGSRISELLPGEETEGNFTFMLKNGVRPLELTVEVQNYNEGCSAGGTNGIVRFVLEDISPPSPPLSKRGQ